MIFNAKYSEFLKNIWKWCTSVSHVLCVFPTLHFGMLADLEKNGGRAIPVYNTREM